MSKWIIFCSEKKQNESVCQETVAYLVEKRHDFVFWSDTSSKSDFKGAKLNFLVIGGDGTLNYFVNCYEAKELYHFGATVTYLPAGTGNDFARSLMISPADIEWQGGELLGRLDESLRVRRVRYSKCNERFFLNTASLGSFALPVREASEEMKGAWGRVAYYQSALKRMVGPEVYELELDFDGETFCERSYGLFIANGSFTGGGFKVGASDEFSDEYLQVVLFRAGAIFQQMKEALIHQFSNEHEWNEEAFTLKRAKEIRVRAQRLIPANLDGEAFDQMEFQFYPSLRRLHFKVLA